MYHYPFVQRVIRDRFKIPDTYFNSASGSREASILSRLIASFVVVLHYNTSSEYIITPV